MSVDMSNILGEFPSGKYRPRPRGKSMKLELHIMRGETVTCLEVPESGTTIAKFQMGTTREVLEKQLEGVAHPNLIRRIVDLYSKPENLHLLEQLDPKQRHLIMRDYA